MEGLHLYLKVVQVFKTENVKILYYYIFGWGKPLFDSIRCNQGGNYPKRILQVIVNCTDFRPNTVYPESKPAHHRDSP